MSNLSRNHTTENRLLVTLYTDQGGGDPQDLSDISVRSCELLGRGFKSRTSFNKNNGIDDVFHPDLATAITEQLKKVRDEVVLSVPDFTISIPGLFLEGLQVLISSAEEATRQIVCRFKRVFGDLNAGFSKSLGLHVQLADEREQIATDTLADIALPILDICNFFSSVEDTGPATQKDRIVSERIKERSHEIRFSLELLKRFIDTEVRRPVERVHVFEKADAYAENVYDQTQHRRRLPVMRNATYLLE